MPVSDAEAGPSIAVVAIASDGARDPSLTIESVRAQSWRGGLQMIVVDTGQGGSGAAVAPYASAIDLLIDRPGAILPQALNAAADAVTADYVLFVAAGAQLWSERTIERLVSALDDRPGVFHGDRLEGERLRRSANFGWLSARLWRGTIDLAWEQALPALSASFFRADLLRASRFDTRLPTCAHLDLLFRLHAAGASIRYIDECVTRSGPVAGRDALEAASIYRRFSEQPQAVDALLLPAGSPFAAQTEATGFHLAGFTRRDVDGASSGLDTEPYWTMADGGTLVAPRRRIDGIAMRGVNPLTGQGFDLVHEGRLLASSSLPPGDYSIDATFAEPIEAGGLVGLRPWLSEPASGGEQVGFALRGFRFLGPESIPEQLLHRGARIRAAADTHRHFHALLRSGWAPAEDDHTWSLGHDCELAIAVDASAPAIRLELSGNPHVPGGRQEALFLVNAGTTTECVFEHGERRTIEIACDAPGWRRGRLNHLAIRLKASARPPAPSSDTRDLGVCLWTVEVA